MIELDNKYDVIDGKYEYSKTLLNGKESKYISIPWSIISNKEIESKKIGILSYLKIKCGYDNVIGFTIPDIVEWCGMKPNKRTGNTNDKFLNVANALSDIGYFNYLTEVSKSSFMKCEFNIDYYSDDCSNGYSVIYVDEIEKILNYKKDNLNNNTLTSTILLLVFTYLRYRIIRRPNELKPEDRFPEKIKKRKENEPEAYSSNINIMAEEIGISPKSFLKAITILEEELKLIVTNTPYRVRNEKDEFRTPPTIFANAYKREGSYMLNTGDNYSRDEILLRAEKMKKYYKGLKLAENKK